MDEPQARGVSLWLMPEGEARVCLAALIERLARRFSTPSFPPHVTLLPGIAGRPEGQVMAASRGLAASLRPFPVRLGVVDGRDEPFRCLYAEATLDEPLRAAHAAAARAFERGPDPGFLPHLSLLYGWLPPEVKRDVATDLAAAVALTFEARRLHVWRTEGPVADWSGIGAFELASG